MWGIIRSVSLQKSTHEPLLTVEVNDHITEDPSTIGNQFNNYFSTAGTNLAETINSETSLDNPKISLKSFRLNLS